MKTWARLGIVSLFLVACSSNSSGGDATLDGENTATGVGGSSTAGATAGKGGGTATGQGAGPSTGFGGTSATGGSNTAGTGSGKAGSGTAGTGTGKGAGGGAGSGTGMGSAGTGVNGTGGKGGGKVGSAGAGGGSAGTAGGSAGTGGGAAGTGGQAGGAGAGGDSAGAGGQVDACAGLDPSKPLVLYQSADDSNSMASPALVRRLIKSGQGVPPYLVRTYEFLNYYRIAYEPADQGHVRVVPELRPGKTGEYDLQIGLASETAPATHRPMTLTFVLDTSGSMGAEGRFDRALAAVKAIAAQMRAGDVISLVTWNTGAAVVLDAYTVTGPGDGTLAATLNGLAVNGGTDLSGGLQKGYQIALAHYDPTRMNRVIMVSDGEANVGVTDANTIGMASHTGDSEGIYLVGVNVGTEAGDDLMNVVTDKGRGASVFLDSIDEANAMFGARFDETMEIAAHGVRLELTVPWYMQMKTFSGEQSSTNMNLVDPQHLAPNDAMVFDETFAPCSASLFNPDDLVMAKATYETPIIHQKQEDWVQMTLGAMLAAPAPHLAKGQAIVAYAEVLKKAPGLPAKDAHAAIDDAIAKAVAADPGGDPELAEIESLLMKYRALYP